MPTQVKTDYDIISQKYLHSDFDTLGNAFFRGDFLFVGGSCREKFPEDQRFVLMGYFQSYLEKFVDGYLFDSAPIDIMKPYEMQQTPKLPIYPLEKILENYVVKTLGSLPVTDEVKLQQMRLKTQWERVKVTAKAIVDGVDKYKLSCYSSICKPSLCQMFYDVKPQVSLFMKCYIDYSGIVGSYEKVLLSV